MSINKEYLCFVQLHLQRLKVHLANERSHEIAEIRKKQTNMQLLVRICSLLFRL